MYIESREIELSGGGKACIWLTSAAPIDPAQWPILQTGSIRAMAEAMVDWANFLRPPNSQEIKLEE